MMSGHNNNLKKKSKGKKQKHKTDDEIYPSMSAHESTNMLKADIQKERGANPGQSSHSSPASKDSPSNFLPKVDELFPAASARVEERVDYWQEDEVQKFMQSNPNQVESSSMSSPINRAHNYLAGTFNVSTDERSSLFSLPDRCSGSRSVFCAVTDFFRGSITAASSGSRSGGGFHYDTTTSPSETETWTMLLPLKRLVLRAITVVLYICDALGIKTALTEKTAAIAHTYVERIFSFPTQLVPQLRSFVRTAYQSMCSLVYRLFTLWWNMVVWCVCIPYHITVFSFRVARSIFFTALVLFLNKAPGGYLVLKALNGHIPRH